MPVKSHKNSTSGRSAAPRGLDALRARASRFPVSKMVERCSVNNETYSSPLDILYDICSNALNRDQVARLRAITTRLTDRDLDGVYAAVLQGNIALAGKIVADALDLRFKDHYWTILDKLLPRSLWTIFRDDPKATTFDAEDFSNLLKYMTDPLVLGIDNIFFATLALPLDTVGKVMSVTTRPGDMLTMLQGLRTMMRDEKTIKAMRVRECA